MTVLCEAAGAVLLAFRPLPGTTCRCGRSGSVFSLNRLPFNNAGFDALGGGTSLIPYQNDLLLNLVTDALVIVGGIGFMVILDVGCCRGNFRKMSYHQGRALHHGGAAGGRRGAFAARPMGWLDDGVFQSMTARTAASARWDFSTGNAGLLVIMLLMFIGASPGSDGGGIKTTTFLC